MNKKIKFLFEKLKGINTYSKILMKAGLQLTCIIYIFAIFIRLFGNHLGRFIIVRAYSDGALEIAPVVLGAAIIMALIYDIVLPKEN